MIRRLKYALWSWLHDRLESAWHWTYRRGVAPNAPEVPKAIPSEWLKGSEFDIPERAMLEATEVKFNDGDKIKVPFRFTLIPNIEGIYRQNEDGTYTKIEGDIDAGLE